MIKISAIPYSTYSFNGMPKPTWIKATCPPNGFPHNFSLSDDDMLTYYLEIFRNRTTKDKPYIDQYNSIEELEEDIYGNCLYEWIPKDFKDIYNNLDKQEFLHKINVLMEQYGNAIVIEHRALCIKTDEDINLYSFYKGLCPDKDILSICILIRIFELGLWETGRLMYLIDEDYYALLKELIVKYEAGELTEEGANDVLAEVDISIVFADPRPVNMPTDILKEIEDKKQNDYSYD